jgi:hypothetical protein
MSKSNGNGGGDINLLTDSLPFRSEPRCNICNSSSREKVDKLLAAQFSYTAIAEELVIADEGFRGKEVDTVRKNVERHSKRHVDIKSRAIRKIIEDRAKEQGILVDEHEGQMTTARGLLDLMISRATTQLSENPDAKVRYADAIEAAKMLEDVARTEYQSRLEQVEKQMWAVSQALKHFAPPTLIPKIVRAAEWQYQHPEKTMADFEKIQESHSIEEVVQ